MRSRLVIKLLGAIAIVGGVGFLISKRRPISSHVPERQPSKGIALRPGITLEGVEGLILRRQGRKVWELSADLIALDKPQTKVTAYDIQKATYYDEEGKALLWFSARSLLYDTETGRVTLSGDLRLTARLKGRKKLVGTARQALWDERKKRLKITGARGEVKGDGKEGWRFHVTYAYYFPDRTVLECPKGVIVTKPDLKVFGRKLRANLDRRFFSLAPPVRIVAILDRSIAPIPSSNPQEKRPEKSAKAKEKRKLHFVTRKPVIGKGEKLFFEEVIVTEEGEDYTITAGKAIYDDPENKLIVEGGIRFEDPETVAVAPKAEVDMDKEVATFFGPVEVTIKPKSKGEKERGEKGRRPWRERLREKGGKVICERVVYDYRERRLIATGKVRFEQADRYKGSAKKLIYLTRKDLLILEGEVEVTDVKRGHRFRCPRITINLETDEVFVEPPVTGFFIVEEEKETAPKKDAEKDQSK